MKSEGSDGKIVIYHLSDTTLGFDDAEMKCIV